MRACKSETNPIPQYMCIKKPSPVERNQSSDDNNSTSSKPIPADHKGVRKRRKKHTQNTQYILHDRAHGHGDQVTPTNLYPLDFITSERQTSD